MTCPRPRTRSRTGPSPTATPTPWRMPGPPPTPRPRLRSTSTKPTCWPSAALESPWDFKQRLARFVKAHSADDGRSEWDRKQAQARLRMWDDKVAQAPSSTANSRPAPPKPWSAGSWAASATSSTAATTTTTPKTRPSPSPNAFTRPAWPKRWWRPAGVPSTRPTPPPAMTGSWSPSPSKTSSARTTTDPGPTMNDGTPVPASVARLMAGEERHHPPRPRRRLGPPRPRPQRPDLQPPPALRPRHVLVDLLLRRLRAPPSPGARSTTSAPSTPTAATAAPTSTSAPPSAGTATTSSDHPDWSFDKLPDGSTITRALNGTQWRRWPDRQRPAQPPPAAATDPGTPDQPAATLFTHAA